MLNRNDSNLHVFSVVYQRNYFIFLQNRGIGKHKELNFVDAILEITQDALRVDQTHHFNLFLLNIHRLS